MRSASTCRKGFGRSIRRRSNTADTLCHPACATLPPIHIQRSSMRKLLLLIALCVRAAYASTPEQWKADYDTLQKWQYGAAVPLSQPITIKSDTATFTLTSGTVALAAPTSSGRITGLVFEGDGHFTMTVPDKYELAQLRRFADDPRLTQIDQPITQLVLRVSDDTIDKLFPNVPKGGPFATNGIAEKRQNHWLVDM